MGSMRILDSSGDTTLTWAPEDTDSVREAAAVFDRLAAERKVPFARRADAPAMDADRIHAFDPAAEEIIWVRPVAGG